MSEAQELTLERLEPLVDAVFTVRSPTGEQAELRLEGVRSLAETMRLPERFREPFALYLRAPETVAWPQGSFELTHPDVGTHAVFCVPIVDPDTRPGRLYEAVFA